MKKFGKFALIILIIGVIFLGIGTAFIPGWGRMNDRPVETAGRQVSLTKFSTVDADVKAYNINLRPGSSYHATVSGKYQHQLKIAVKNQTLVIREQNYHRQPANDEPQVTITVPRAATHLKQVVVTANAGRVDLAHLTMQELRLDLNAGAASLNDIAVKHRARAIMNAGSLKISHSKLSLKAQVDAGAVKIDHSKFHGTSILSLNAGSLSMTEAPDIGYDLSTSFGPITYHGKNQGHHFEVQASAKNKLVAETDFGSIKIN
ncbi:DUF4097 family beta strand repeat-containing protein [Lactobacillus xylocopicola]|uniref:DUF4097 domain-containing protein n=1 Tax=Lactobacillus xylocopicola TaxID=2976676 RepID=A0ABN6SI82_9LACO|nr:DUF4097 family beta strand repeat-containing protein [Lactobacillus xylocopicola]BDR59825.1 hypothetical protein KIM322_00860 [Lactobacillus xylocopicola]